MFRCDSLFLLKKIISSLITIPGVFIVCLFVLGVYGFRKRVRLLQVNLILGFIIYCCSISLIANFLIGRVEQGHFYNGEIKVDVIILLGGGIIEGVADFSGKSIPASDMMARLVDAVRLYNRYRLPVIVSGGSAGGEEKEAIVVRRFLIDLGVNTNDIIIEDASRDTVENALNVKRIFLKRRFTKGLLVTSAYHIKRARYLFEQAGLDVLPYSSGYLSEKKSCFSIFELLPNIGDLRKSAIAIKETIGIVFYYLKYEML